VRANLLMKKLDRWLGIPLVLLLGACLRVRDLFCRESTTDPGRLLVSKLSAVGDTVVLVPALRALRRRYPAAQITFLCSSINVDVTGCFPTVGGRRLVDDIILWDLAAYAKQPWTLLPFLRSLRACRFDVTIDFEQWIRATSLVTAVVGAPRRFGFRTKGQHRHYAYNGTVAAPPQQHEVRNFLALAALADARDDDGAPRLALPSDALAWADAQLPPRTGGPRIAFHPGCGATGRPREWPAAHYVELGRRLLAEHQATLVLTGGPGERDLAERIRQALAAPSQTPNPKSEIQNAAGPTTFAQFAALLSRCDILVCGNTGALHIGAAAGTHVVGLHGPTNPNKWGPVGGDGLGDRGHTVLQSSIWCSPCLDLGFEYGCDTYPCMPLIEVARVYQAVAGLME